MTQVATLSDRGITWIREAGGNPRRGWHRNEYAIAADSVEEARELAEGLVMGPGHAGYRGMDDEGRYRFVVDYDTGG